MPAVVFPTEHMVRVIEAARAGKTILDFPVYDGSDTGDKVFDTLTVIGRRSRPTSASTMTPRPQSRSSPESPRWPVTISYFDKAKTPKNQRTDTGLCDRLRALRERHFARA